MDKPAVVWHTAKAWEIDSGLRELIDSHDLEVSVSESLPYVPEGATLLCFGGKPLKELQRAGWLPKNRTITSLRETVHQCKGRNVLVTFGPNIKDYDYTNYVKYQTDLNLFERYLTTGSIDPVYGEYKWVKDYEHLPYLINDRYNETGKPVRVAMDLETVGLDPFDPDKFIVSISFSVDEGKSELIRFSGVEDQPKEGDPLWYQIQWLLNDDRVSLVGANLKYDRLWIRVKWGILCTNHRLDTTLVGSLLDENRSNSLNTHCKIYAPELGGYDDPFNKKYDKSRMDLVPSDDLLLYAGGDTDATLRVANKVSKQLARSASQTRFYTKLLHPSSEAFEDMEYTGVHIDIPYYQGLQVEVLDTMQRIENEIKDLMPKRILLKYGDDFSLTKSALIKDFMFTHPSGLRLTPKLLTEKTGDPSTAYNHLIMFDDDQVAHEFVKLYKEWNSAKKTESTYIKGFLKHVRPDGLLHPTAILYRGDYGGTDSGTITGRLAFKDPAYQTLPKHSAWAKKLRRGYIAPEGYAIVNWDYSQGELRVIACVANEQAMIEAYRSGIDMHLKTGSELNGYTLEQALEMKANKDPEIKKIRQGGKAGNFGLIYGISPEGYVIYARDTYGVILTLEEARHQHEVFFSMYPGLVSYHEEYKAIAHKMGAVQSPLGRVRHLPMIHSSNYSLVSQAERQAINSPIQSTLSDLSQLALAEFKKRHGYNQECRFFAMTHDALTAYVRLDRLDYWVPEVTNIMENLPITPYFGWKPQLVFETDAEVGYNLGDMRELADYPGMAPSEALAA